MSITRVIVPVLLIAAALALFTAVNEGRTAGIKTPDCMMCHTDATTAEAVITGLPDEYKPGETYTVKVEITAGPESPGPNQGGFLLIVDKGDFQVTAELAVEEVQGKKAVRHTADSVGKRSWEFQWVAPPAGSGDVTFELSAIAANGDNSPIGDGFAQLTKTIKEEVPPAAPGPGPAIAITPELAATIVAIILVVIAIGLVAYHKRKR